MRVISEEDYKLNNYNNLVQVKDLHELEEKLNPNYKYDVVFLRDSHYADAVIKLRK